MHIIRGTWGMPTYIMRGICVGKKICGAALQNNAVIEIVTPKYNHDILIACKEVEPKIIDYLKEKLEETHIKWYVNMHCVFKKPKKDAVTGAPTEDFDTEDVYQASKTYAAIQPEDINAVIPEVFQTITNTLEIIKNSSTKHIVICSIISFLTSLNFFSSVVVF